MNVLEIDFFGPANFQLILTKKGPMIFEINPRFSSTVLMRNYLGFTDCFGVSKKNLVLS